VSEIHPDQDFQTFLAQGQFMLQRSKSSGRHVFYPRVAEPLTGAQDLEWVEASGLGTIYSTTVVRNKPPVPDHNIVLVDLAEGVRMMSQVIGLAPDAVTIGLKVRAKIGSLDGEPAVLFEPVEGQSA
jgi:uncharacterized OB-fold protein